MPLPRKAAVGQTLEGRFLLLEEIAKGGMSTVFKGRDLKDGGATVAVKVPLPEYEYSSGVGAWSMTQREAEIGAALNHPGIVRFIPVSQGGPQTPLVVTEFVAGTTLAERLRDGTPLPEAEALRIAKWLCEVVEYMHDYGIVHYDLTPRNVIVGADRSLRLIDFGTAHARVKSRLTIGGPAPAVATANYAAPEQVRRRRGQPSVDIYAIGAMLYEMLTGHPPFEGDDPYVVASARHIGDPKAPRALNPNLSPQVEEIMLRALRRDPTERYASAAAFGAELTDPSQVLVTGLAKRLIAVTRWRKGLRWARYLALVTIVPLATLVILFEVLWWHFERR